MIDGWEMKWGIEDRRKYIQSPEHDKEEPGVARKFPFQFSHSDLNVNPSS